MNEIDPGFVDAGLSAQAFEQVPDSQVEWRRLVPTKKLLSTEPVARKVAFLFHPDAYEITGIFLILESGLSVMIPGYLPAP